MTTELTRAEAATATRGEVPGQAYVLEGTLLEACKGNVLCPGWIGEGGTRDGFLPSSINSRLHDRRKSK